MMMKWRMPWGANAHTHYPCGRNVLGKARVGMTRTELRGAAFLVLVLDPESSAIADSEDEDEAQLDRSVN